MNTEEFWKGEFGDEYAKRQTNMIESNRKFFIKIFVETRITPVLNGVRQDRAPRYHIESITEFGAGTGMNISALNLLFKGVQLTSVEINREAAEKIPYGQVYIGSMYDFKTVDPPSDLVLTKGFLIHQPPEKINIAYDIMYRSSARFILMAEYYNPIPVEVEYRGHSGKLWKRDFCGEIMQRYPDLKLVDYGFVYHKDKYPQDDLTWFLLEKPSA